MRPRLLAILALLVLAAAALAGCGGDDRTTAAEGLAEANVPEGLYTDLGGLKYQVQISRELNPFDVEDHAYLIGLPQGAAQLRPTETWFGVFVRVQYDRKNGQPLPAAREFELEDTVGNVWRPVPLADVNVFAYRPLTLKPTQILPLPGSVAAENSIQGSLLLFRVPFNNLQNRPLVLKITNPQNPRQVAAQDLDV